MKTLITILVSIVMFMNACGSSGGGSGAGLVAQVASETLPECKPATSEVKSPAKKADTEQTAAAEVTAEVPAEVTTSRTSVSTQESTQDSTQDSTEQTYLKLTSTTCVDPQANEVKSGVQIMLCDGSMMTGTMVVEAAAPIYAQCAQNSQVDCVANSTYVAINPASIPAAEGHVNCSENNQVGCISTDSYKAANLTNLSAGNILSGVVIAGTTGSLVVPTVPANCASDNQIGCVTTASYPSLSPASIPVAESHIACTSDNQTGCVATSTYKAVNLSSLVASNLRTGIVVAGITGTLTPNAESHTDCDANSQIGCVTTATYPSMNPASIPVAESHTDCTANSQTGCVTTATYQSMNPASIPVAESHTDCSSDGQTACVATNSFKAVSMAALTSGVIKSGTSIAGITGAYPSATYPLTNASTVADLDYATFTAKIKASAAFEWFGPDGTRYETTGDSDITSANIASGISVFGTTGTHAELVAPDAWNVRKGIAVNGVTGSLPTTCRLNTDGTVPEASRCSTDNPNVWQDLTPSGGCTVGKTNCMYKARDTNLTWARWSGAIASQALRVTYCSTLSLNGLSGWRMPSVSEAVGLVYRQVGSLPLAFRGNSAYGSSTWTVDTEPVANQKIYADLGNVNIHGAADNNLTGVMCVHD